MAPLWMLLLVVAADPEKSAHTAQNPPPAALASRVLPKGPRTGLALTEAVQAALRRWAHPTSQEAEPAAREFLALYEELGNDRSLGVSTRQQLRLKVRTRLAQLAEQIAKRPGKGDRHLLPERPATNLRSVPGFAQKVPVPFSGAARAEPPAKIGLPPGKQDRLAQLGGPGAGGVAGRGRAGRGPGTRGGVGARGVPPQNFGPPDAGKDLVDLIQRTIAPSTWDVNGGPGTIRYWRPGAALVIRQTSEMHGDVADFVEQLQR